MDTPESIARKYQAAGMVVDTLRDGRWWVLVTPAHGLRVLQAGYEDTTLLWNAERPPPTNWCIGGNRTWLAPEFSNPASSGPRRATAVVFPTLCAGATRFSLKPEKLTGNGGPTARVSGERIRSYT
jgi:hypothetical protein